MNEDPIAASQDAPPGATAPLVSPSSPATPNTRSTSRFYSRMNRGYKATAAPTAGVVASSEPVTLDALTVEEATKLKDNLPVRATAAPGLEATEFGGPREDRPPREGRDRDHRGGRGRDRDRGDREGGRERKFDRDRDRGRDDSRPRYADRPVAAAESVASSPAPTEAPRPAPIVSEPVSAPAAATPLAPAPVEAPRKLRFEDASTHQAPRTVQEFRPSHDRDFHREAERARNERQKRDIDPAAEAKSPGLFGWMKSIFAPKPDESAPPATPADRPRDPQRERERNRDRGPRPQGGGHAGSQGHGGHGGGGGEGGEHGGRRRRRRRGGRNRNRGGGGQGDAGGGGSHVGGGD